VNRFLDLEVEVDDEDEEEDDVDYEGDGTCCPSPFVSIWLTRRRRVHR